MKNIIVTGAAGGIGREIVKQLIARGDFIWAFCHTRRPETEAFFAEFGNRVEPFYFDLADCQAVKSAVQTIAKEKRAVHGLVNNAGTILPNRLFSMTPMEEFEHSLKVNLLAPAQLTQLVIRLMLRSPEEAHSIVNISSIAALDGDPGQTEYVVGKAGLIGMTRKLARELSPQRIRVNAVAPGMTDTPMIKSISPELKEETLKRASAHEFCRPEDIAAVVTFLLSESSRAINGQVIRAENA